MRKLMNYSLVVLFVVLFSGLGLAFSVDYSFEKDSVSLGENATIYGVLNISENEKLPVDYFEIFLGNIKCKFNANGSAVIGCEGFNIEQIDYASFSNGNLTGNYFGKNYSWGKGFGYGANEKEAMRYKITLNSSILGAGIINASFRSKMVNNLFERKGNSLIVIKDIKIVDLNSSDECVLENEGFELRANIEGSLKEVLISVDNGTNTKIFGLGNKGEGVYRHSVNANDAGTGEFKWKFFVKDLDNNVVYGEENSLKVHSRTEIEVMPSSPDGLNGWYVNAPRFMLTNPEAGKISYSWNGEYYVYDGEFGIEGLPNNGNKTGGIHSLKFWSDVCGEHYQNRTFKFDFNSPVIKDMSPKDKEIVSNTNRPVIFARVDEIYQGNSGVNINNLSVKIDDKLINRTDYSAVVADKIDAELEIHLRQNLSNGVHEVEISAMDLAGRTSVAKWQFEIDVLPQDFSISLNSPNDIFSDKKRVLINISATKKVAEVLYVILNEKNPRERVLCKNCGEYGSLKKKYLSLNEGLNELVVIARDDKSMERTDMINFTVDTKKPKISKTEPKKDSITNGKSFRVVYSEENLESVELHYGIHGEKVLAKNCGSGKNVVCEFNLTQGDLAEFNGKKIVYYFVVIDGANSVASKVTSVKIDSVEPNLVIFSPLNANNYSRYVPFNITAGEKSTIEIMNLNSGRGWERVCKDCESFGYSKKFEVYSVYGAQKYAIRATDKAGNSVEKIVSFKVI